MKIEIWSDVVCPWCYIGKRRLESALGQFEHGASIEVRWRSFELDPGASETPVPLDELLAEKYGMSREDARKANARVTELAAAEGLDYHLDRATNANSFDAHRLIHLAETRGKQAEMKERLMRAHFVDTLPVGDPETLRQLGKEVGLPEDEVEELLQGDLFAEEVRADEAAARAIGVSGVPFFLIEGKWGISGAQPTELFVQALEQTWSEVHSA